MNHNKVTLLLYCFLLLNKLDINLSHMIHLSIEIQNRESLSRTVFKTKEREVT